jgi:hypothetical protein
MFIKLNLFFCSLAVATVLTCCSRPESPKYDGTLDVVNCDQFLGWAWDESSGNRPITVNIYDGDSLIASIKADGLRPDLKTAGKGDGNHAFIFPAPVSLKNGQAHLIHAKIGESGSNWELIGSPREISCPSQ